MLNNFVFISHDYGLQVYTSLVSLFTWEWESTGLSGGQSLTLSRSLPLSLSLSLSLSRSLSRSLSLSRSRLCSRSRSLSRERSRFFRRLPWWEDDLELLCSDRCSCPLPGTWRSTGTWLPAAPLRYARSMLSSLWQRVITHLTKTLVGLFMHLCGSTRQNRRRWWWWWLQKNNAGFSKNG